jgi:hypothetical protein
VPGVVGTSVDGTVAPAVVGVALAVDVSSVSRRESHTATATTATTATTSTMRLTSTE